MRILIQRVNGASVEIENRIKSNIHKGLLVLVGIENNDDVSDIIYLTNKVVNLRLFDDETGKMNDSVKDINGEILVISQFTLYANTKKGHRPSYLDAAKPELAIPMYNLFIHKLSEALGKQIETGIFGADMKVALVNDGPVTIWLDSKVKN
jgi:D-tyrosyl-tRNA(Tyr) deacylase